MRRERLWRKVQRASNLGSAPTFRGMEKDDKQRRDRSDGKEKMLGLRVAEKTWKQLRQKRLGWFEPRLY